MENKVLEELGYKYHNYFRRYEKETNVGVMVIDDYHFEKVKCYICNVRLGPNLEGLINSEEDINKLEKVLDEIIKVYNLNEKLPVYLISQLRQVYKELKSDYNTYLKSIKK